MSTTTAILYAGGAALLVALRPCFAKIADKRTAPSLMATLYASVVFVAYLASAMIGGTARSVLSVDNLTLLKLLGAGALRACIWLCLFAALSTGQVNRVMPLYLLSDVTLTVLSLILGKEQAGIWRLCCIVLILLGVVMTESRSTKAKSARWLIFALLALAANIGLSYYRDAFLSSAPAGAIRLGEASVAAVLLWILSAAGKAMNSFKKMTAENWIFIVLAGLCGALALYCEMQTQSLADVTVLNPIRCAILPLTVLMARIINKERMPANAVLGVALFTAGTFGLMLNL